MSAWRKTSRPLIYEPRGGNAFVLNGTLTRPSAAELVGGLDEQQNIFTGPWSDFLAAGVTTPTKFDGVTDPGPAALSELVAAEVGADEIKLAGVDATGAVSFAVGARWTAYNATAASWQSGTVLAINPAGAGTIQLSSTSAGLLNQSILIYPAEVQQFSAHNVAIVYAGRGPEFVRCEVTG